MKLYFILILSFCALQSSFATYVYYNRKYLDINIHDSLKCFNTEFGREYIADDQGYVCYRKNLSYENGCCVDGTQYQCASCDLDDQCCAIYEHCVSCCLKPENNANHKYMNELQSPKHPDAGYWDDVFEYCKGKCRTHGHSTIHENAFISQRHYCFSSSGIPNVPEPMLLPKLAENVKIKLSHEGDDCDETCDELEMKCSNDGFISLNSCNVMRRYFGCEADCSAREDSKESGPYYISESAPNSENPAACVLWNLDNIQSKKLLSSGLDLCKWKKDHVIRLCPCISIN